MKSLQDLEEQNRRLEEVKSLLKVERNHNLSEISESELMERARRLGKRKQATYESVRLLASQMGLTSVSKLLE